MATADFRFIYAAQDVTTFGKVPCQNCGKMVTVQLPFVGCVFCEDCHIHGDTGWQADSEDFFDFRRLEAW